MQIIREKMSKHQIEYEKLSERICQIIRQIVKSSDRTCKTIGQNMQNYEREYLSNRICQIIREKMSNYQIECDIL